jgi:predicted RNA-binding protein with PUA-like domain
MAGTRRSTRQTAVSAPKYNEDAESSAEETQSKRITKKTTRRKRGREEDDDNDDDNKDTPPPKKAATTKTKTLKAKTNPPETTTISKPKMNPPPAPSSPTNRDATGAQEIYWLLKAEPLPRYENGKNVAFSISDLRACTAPEPWSGVRNAQARNNMQAMRAGDLGFFYHSNAKPSGIAGILRVVDEAKVDETAFDPEDPYYDKKSERERPKWFCVNVEFVSEFEEVVDLARIKEYAREGPLAGMQLVTNSRLSVSRVRREEWEFILDLAKGGKQGEGEEEKEGEGEKEGERGDVQDGVEEQD